jgi:peptidoglycan/xylan/chitin deacetylase (PgdA/CDA1 family)
MATATSESLERVSAERRALWFRRRRRRRAGWVLIGVAVVAGGAMVALWPHSHARPAAAPVVAPPVPPKRTVTKHPLRAQPDKLAALRAALPLTAGIVHGSTAGGMVALTFDDGPSGRTPAILRVLQHHGAHATFFVVGRTTRGQESVLRHIVKTGNELADHTYSHADLLALRGPGRTRQLDWTKVMIKDATGVEPRFFRPPYGATSPAVNQLARYLGLIPILWTVDSQDWERPGTKVIVRRVLAGLHPGAIILMHDGGGNRQQTLRALPAILRAIKRRGLHAVTLSRMLTKVPPPSAFWSGSFDGGDARS